MEFGFDKCSSLVIKRGVVEESGGIVLPTKTIKALAVDASNILEYWKQRISKMLKMLWQLIKRDYIQY